MEAIRVRPADEERAAGRLLRWALLPRSALSSGNAFRDAARCRCGPRPIRRPASHPDLVLVEAVPDGVLIATKAGPVGETRIDGCHLAS